MHVTNGPDIRFTIYEVTGSKVRISFEAPPEVIILREEVETRDKSN